MTTKDKIYNCLTLAIWMVLVLVALLSCGTTHPTVVERTRTDTLKVVQHHRDSIYVHDSIMVTQAGDTVRVDRWHTLYRDRWHTDTLRHVTHDTIPQPYPVEVVKEVEKPLTWWQRTSQGVGTWALILAAMFAVYKVIRWKIKIL